MIQSNFDFSIPQRQSLIGIFVLFANTLQKSIRALWPIILVFVFNNKEYKPFFIYLTIFGIVVLITIIAFLRYWFFKFYIDYQLEEFVIESGIFNKTKTTIPFHKIQKVTIDQSLIQRIFSVHKLELDTAGSDKKEASIKAISQQMAVELKRSLLENTKEKALLVPETELVERQDESFITISLPSLLKIGITSNYLISFIYLIGIFSTISENLKQIGKENLIDENINQLERLPIVSLLLGFLIFSFTAIIITNLVITVLKYFNFTIKKDGKSFVLTYGLLNIKNTIINPEKVQIIKITQNFFQKKLNINTIEIFQASSDMKRASVKDRTKIPGCNTTEKEQIVKLIINRLPAKEVTLYPNIRKLLIGILFFIILPVSIGIVINYTTNRFPVNAIGLMISLYSLIMGLILFISYKNYRLFISDEFIVQQSGAWDIDHKIIMPYKIQAIKTQQFFWQKLTNIGSIELYTAGGRISFSTANFEEIKEQVNKWLYQVEVSKENWM
ncbi:PH domain-containing protein [Flavobacterium jejuense]|uniref:PH domain-containing protein n=1 Tax=Flavobacterium jejuense TaxID=1544455 RepID=A0ABX0IKF7_9FLAO|nr:PH domain-containing protein [Flavobacterium jejuense]NHN24203.1 PH domain-containing protein [Flavobacterium jejuense]